MSFLKNLKYKFLNLLFPIECAGCGREDVWLCRDCLLKISPARQENCFRCGRESALGQTCADCAVQYDLDGVFVAADYDHKVVAELIKKLKYSFARELGETLAEIIELYFKRKEAEGEKINLKKYDVAPIPLHRRRYNWRGFNQAEIIARSFAARFGLTYAEPLIRAKHKTPQARLGAEERKTNITGCFVAGEENISGKNFLLIDDVATTGSTLNEAAKVLKAAGAKKIWGLVVAKG